jgi:serine/threonine protein phosphatase PrpC
VDVRSIELDLEGDDGEEGYRRDGFVILASDGVWDVFESSQDVVDFCHGVLDEDGGDGGVEDRKSDLGKRIVEEAERRGSMDNISAVVVWLS